MNELPDRFSDNHFAYCQWCDHIRNESITGNVKKESVDKGVVYKYQYKINRLFCALTGRVIICAEHETCSEWLEMDYAF